MKESFSIKESVKKGRDFKEKFREEDPHVEGRFPVEYNTVGISSRLAASAL